MPVGWPTVLGITFWLVVPVLLVGLWWLAMVAISAAVICVLLALSLLTRP